MQKHFLVDIKDKSTGYDFASADCQQVKDFFIRELDVKEENITWTQDTGIDDIKNQFKEAHRGRAKELWDTKDEKVLYVYVIAGHGIEREGKVRQLHLSL